ncbi:riboflavin synthase [Candidatus Peregrinibacteria bacterium]|nr:MAG: riboflavin synthase [Candidatus Peregrinibacteria bacterium]
MFTGIIQSMGTVRKLDGQVVEVAAAELIKDLKIGSSIAVDGSCLTVTSFVEDGFTADYMPETADRTILGGRKVGDLVNLELPMAANGRFEGHIVSGHVDATGAVVSIEERGNSKELTIEFANEFAKYVVEKGSVTLNGISLTVSGVQGAQLKVSLIPHTWAETNLHLLQPGDRVNIEFDLLAKHLEKLKVNS